MVTLNLDTLLEYTDWERGKWQEFLSQHGDSVLQINAGPHGDGRFHCVGDLVKHIFSAEKRYVDRLCGRPLTDTTALPNDNVEALFAFSQQSRKDLREFLETFPAQQWDAPQEFKIVNSFLRATPKAIIVHVLMHEIRHWAQISTLFRLNGLAVEWHDFLMSGVLGSEVRREPEKTAEAAKRS